jgi:hypothetical protein
MIVSHAPVSPAPQAGLARKCVCEKLGTCRHINHSVQSPSMPLLQLPAILQPHLRRQNWRRCRKMQLSRTGLLRRATSRVELRATKRQDNKNETKCHGFRPWLRPGSFLASYRTLSQPCQICEETLKAQADAVYLTRRSLAFHCNAIPTIIRMVYVTPLGPRNRRSPKTAPLPIRHDPPASITPQRHRTSRPGMERKGRNPNSACPQYSHPSVWLRKQSEDPRMPASVK